MDMADNGTMTMDEHEAIMEEEGNSSSVSPMLYIALGISLLSFLLAAIALLRGRRSRAGTGLLPEVQVRGLKQVFVRGI